MSSLLVPGPVPEDSALSVFLRERVLAEVLGLRNLHARFRLRRLGGGAVLRCDEEQTSISLALKSYQLKWIFGHQGGDAWDPLRNELMLREYHSLCRARSLGLDRPPISVVRPLAMSPELGYLIVEEFVSGEHLGQFLVAAARHGRHAELRERLSQVAAFLAQLHNASATTRPGGDEATLTYLETVIGQLAGESANSVITAEQEHWLRSLGRKWRESRVLREFSEVLIHGDATPTQFLFSDDGLVVVDLERLQYGDRAADIGRVAGEIRHLFTVRQAPAAAAESHIRDFYRDYHRRAGEPGDFGSLTERARFHMACSELRIARNAWEPVDHRRWLVDEAIACLRG